MKQYTKKVLEMYSPFPCLLFAESSTSSHENMSTGICFFSYGGKVWTLSLNLKYLYDVTTHFKENSRKTHSWIAHTEVVRYEGMDSHSNISIPSERIRYLKCQLVRPN